MRFLLRHFLALMLLLFLCKIAVEAQDSVAHSNLPKALLLSQLAPEAPIPHRIDPGPVIRSLQRGERQPLRIQNGL